MEKQLFSLLRLGLGTSTLEREDISDLLTASEKQWAELEEMARIQGVYAIVLDGLKAVMDELGTGCFNHFEDSSFWRRFILKWALSVEKSYEERNRKQYTVITDIQQRWGGEGIRMMLMKGMAMGTYYPIPNHRATGDIDCYLFADYARGNTLARDWADKVDEGWYKHSQIRYRGELIENHQYFVHTREGRSSKALEQILVRHLQGTEFEKLPGTDVLLPPPMFNALFLTYHALTHFLEEGLRLKQLLDWAMFLRKDADKLDWPVFYETCDRYHMRRFADLATDMAVHLFGVQLDNLPISSDSSYTKKVLKSTLYDKDYVFSSGQGGWANRWHIVKNLIKYRWKFHQIYQHSVLRQLWYYATGYILKTE